MHRLDRPPRGGSRRRGAVSGVSVMAGATQVQRMWSFACCRAMVRVSMATPALAAAYGCTGEPGEALSPGTDPVLTMAPPPWRSIWGTTWVQA
jgi:hypothetical protein